MSTFISTQFSTNTLMQIAENIRYLVEQDKKRDERKNK
jgi:hypothetical protein